jgi:hypothetical protein
LPKKVGAKKEELPKFEITAEPDYLEDLDIIWTLALESQNEEVY